MNWENAGAVTVSEEQATKNAQEFVTKMGQGYSIGKLELAPGYYEFMVQKDGKDYAERKRMFLLFSYKYLKFQGVPGEKSLSSKYLNLPLDK